MKIKISDGRTTIKAELEKSELCCSFVKKLPLETEIKNYASCEKYFFTEKLEPKGAECRACPAGSIAYFEPWNKVALIYKNLSAFPSLYNMGKITECIGQIKNLEGIITVQAET